MNRSQIIHKIYGQICERFMVIRVQNKKRVAQKLENVIFLHVAKNYFSS